MVRRLLVPALVATGLVATSFGTAHAATVSPATWAPKFCTAVIDYQTTISHRRRVVDVAASRTSPISRADATRSSRSSATWSTAAKTAKREIKSAGAPSSAERREDRGGVRLRPRRVGEGVRQGRGRGGKAADEPLPKPSRSRASSSAGDLTAAGDELSKSFTWHRQARQGQEARGRGQGGARVRASASTADQATSCSLTSHNRAAAASSCAAALGVAGADFAQ